MRYIDENEIEQLKQTFSGSETYSGAKNTHESFKKYMALTIESIHESIKALDTKDYELFGKKCHQLKANIAYLGGVPLEARCIEMEKLSLGREYDEILSQKNDFKDCCKNTLEAIQSYMEKI